MLNRSLINEFEEKLEAAKKEGSEFMIGLSWKDSKGDMQHYFMQHHLSKEDTHQAWMELSKLVENAV